MVAIDRTTGKTSADQLVRGRTTVRVGTIWRTPNGRPFRSSRRLIWRGMRLLCHCRRDLVNFLSCEPQRNPESLSIAVFGILLLGMGLFMAIPNFIGSRARLPKWLYQ